jgi:starch phosphorylase
MARLAPEYSANRMLEQYLQTYYIPAAAAYRKRSAGGLSKDGNPLPAAEAAAIQDWQAILREHWHEIRFLDYEVEEAKTGGKAGAPGKLGAAGRTFTFAVDVDLGAVPPGAVRLELYAEPLEGAPPSLEALSAAKPAPPEIHVLEAQFAGQAEASSDTRRYVVKVRTARPPGDFTPRVVPAHPGALVPLEAGDILWFR